MNPHPAADADAAAAGAASVGDVLPRIARGAPPQRPSCTYFRGGPQRLIDLARSLLGLIDVARSPGGSGPMIPIAGTTRPREAFYKMAPRELPGLIDVACSPCRSDSVIPIASVILIDRNSLIQYLPAGVVRGSPAAAHNQRRQLPPSSWSLEHYYGDPLFEIFEVSANFPLAGQVLASGGMATEIICQLKYDKYVKKTFYSERAAWVTKHPGSKAVDFRVKLPPTGPTSYISADSGVMVGVKIDATKNKGEELYSRLLDWQDSPMSDKCKTATIKTSKGVVNVLCAVINEAVEVGLCVGLCIPSELCSSSIYGSITARTDIFDPKITIFTRGVESAIKLLRRVDHPVPNFLCAKSYRHVTLPLARTFLAVPIRATRIEFEGELTIGKFKTLSVKESIPLNAEDITSKWARHGKCYTSLSLCVRRAR